MRPHQPLNPPTRTAEEPFFSTRKVRRALERVGDPQLQVIPRLRSPTPPALESRGGPAGGVERTPRRGRRGIGALQLAQLLAHATSSYASAPFFRPTCSRASAPGFAALPPPSARLSPDHHFGRFSRWSCSRLPAHLERRSHPDLARRATGFAEYVQSATRRRPKGSTMSQRLHMRPSS